MKIAFLSILMTLLITFTISLAQASSTTVSDIKNPDIICIHMAKPEALVFKTSKPQKIWKTVQDREGHIRNVKALQLGQPEINAKSKSFKAHITEGYQLTGLFENQSAEGNFSLSVKSMYLPDGDRSDITDHYNCSVAN